MSQVSAASYIAILRGIGAPVTLDNLAALLGWQRAEGGTASYNPFNTTLMAPGASSYNSVGVRNYTSAAQGVQATVATLKGSAYAGVVGALRKGNDPAQVAAAVGASPWGTPTFTSDIPSGMTLVNDLKAIGVKEKGGNFFAVGGSVSGLLGDVTGAVGGAASSAAGAIPGVSQAKAAADAVSTAAGDVVSPSWWGGMLLRVGFMVMGMVLLAVGILRLLGHAPGTTAAARISPQLAEQITSSGGGGVPPEAVAA
jgi:hypothetical protein